MDVGRTQNIQSQWRRFRMTHRVRVLDHCRRSRFASDRRRWCCQRSRHRRREQRSLRCGLTFADRRWRPLPRRLTNFDFVIVVFGVKRTSPCRRQVQSELKHAARENQQNDVNHRRTLIDFFFVEQGQQIENVRRQGKIDQ